ncbi:MAG: hypothetical protein Q7K35_03715 [bacterium]|nr:hypothetical protein [bacterium]
MGQQNQKISSVVNFRQSLFWDIDPRTLNIKKHANYIIERIMEFGKDKEVKWLWRTYSQPQLKKVVRSSRVLNPRTKTLWSLLLKN